MAYTKKTTRTRRPYRRRTVKRVTRKPNTNLVALIKKVSLKQCETKMSSCQEVGVSLFHNLAFFRGGFIRTSQGDTDNSGYGTSGSAMNGTRTGDEIILRGMSFKFYHETAATRPNACTKIFIFWHRTGQGPSDSTFWCGTDGNGGSMLRMLDSPNNEKITVIKTMLIQHQPNYAIVQNTAGNSLERVCGTYKSCYIKFGDRKIKFDGDNSFFPKFKDIGIAAVSCDVNGTLTTDCVAYLNYSVRMYYKDP